MLTREQQIARVFKAFSDENRIIILQKLQKGEICACHLLQEMNIGQSTLSHHLRILAEAEIINCRREGKWIYYSISETGWRRAKMMLCETLRQKIGSPSPCCSCCCEKEKEE